MNLHIVHMGNGNIVKEMLKTYMFSYKIHTFVVFHWDIHVYTGDIFTWPETNNDNNWKYFVKSIIFRHPLEVLYLV